MDEQKPNGTCLELVEKIGHEEEELHSGEAFAQALPLANRKWNHFGHRLEVTVGIKESFGIEASRIREHLKRIREITVV